MAVLASLVFTIHLLLLAALCIFGLHRLSMVLRWVKYRNKIPKEKTEFATLPKVTVQIPLYNERFVAKRIVDACARLDYPRHLLQIQIVDDSTDDTKDIIAHEVALQKANGLDIEQVRRDSREGFKAGALKEAMEHATGEYIAIFDADFIPPTDLLINNIGYFVDDELALLQFRWGHLNRYSSRMTESQAMMLDAHFALEQQVRWASNKLFNFNGTAGMWRKEAIYDAGNWSADTLTEDLDLSYRAQMKGWKGIYLNNVVCPGELPADMNAFKSQQHRWAKGGLQVMLKLFKTIWRHKAPLKVKVEATLHLSNNLAYFVMLLDTIVFLVPSLWIREYYQLNNMLWMDIPLVLFSTGGHLIYLFFGQVALERSKLTALYFVPRLMLLGIQLAFNNARAGLEAIRGEESEFVRTPKSGEQTSKRLTKDKKQTERYYAKVPNSAIIELIVAATYGVVLAWALINQVWIMVPFLALLIIGFFTTAIDTLSNRFRPESN